MESLNNSKYYFKEADSTEELHQCYNIRYNVYCEEKKWLNPSNYIDKLEIDEFDKHAYNLIALNSKSEVIALLRLLPSWKYPTLPYLNHPAMLKKPKYFERCAEISRLIIYTNVDRHILIQGLFKEAYQIAKRTAIKNLIILVEPSLLRYLYRFYYFFTPISTPAMYFGNFTFPCVADLNKQIILWKTKFPDYYNFISKKSKNPYLNKLILQKTT